MTTDIDAVRHRLIESHLLTEAAIEQELEAWRQDAGADAGSAEAFLDWLEDRGLITDFQADALLAGHAGPFHLGPYVVYEHVASGWLGGIFRAVHEEFEQPVSLKVFANKITTDPEKLARIGRELRIASELDHPNLVRSFDVGQVGDVSYLAMEDLKGQTLSNLLEEADVLPYENACRITRDVAKGLASLHASKILHRDIRPENIWVTPTGSPKIMEFGGARDPLGFLDTADGGDELSTDETEIGQYEYMSPEQARDVRDADTRSDIYSLGCVLYHCIAGRPPFTSKNPLKLAMMHVKDAPAPLSELVDNVPKGIDETMQGMLAKDAADRFQKAEDVAFALDQFAPSEAGEEVQVGNINPDYVKWARSRHPSEETTVSDDAIGVTPELAEFLNWMGAKKPRKRRRR